MSWYAAIFLFLVGNVGMINLWYSFDASHIRWLSWLWLSLVLAGAYNAARVRRWAYCLFSALLATLFLILPFYLWSRDEPANILSIILFTFFVLLGLAPLFFVLFGKSEWDEALKSEKPKRHLLPYNQEENSRRGALFINLSMRAGLGIAMISAGLTVWMLFPMLTEAANLNLGPLEEIWAAILLIGGYATIRHRYWDFVC